MDKTVWKYELRAKTNEFDMPLGASSLRVGFQGELLCLWVCVAPGEFSEKRTIFVSGTGEGVPMKAAYIGSVSTEVFEWHVWEWK